MPIGVWVAIVGVIITVLLQFASMVWFAATMSANQKTNIKLTESLQETVQALHEFIHAMDRRVTLLEHSAIYLPERRETP